MQIEWNLTLNPIFSEVFGTQGFSNPKNCTGDSNHPPKKNPEIEGSFENQELDSTGIIWWASLYIPDRHWMQPITCYQGFV
jgi:hypothetical protein